MQEANKEEALANLRVLELGVGIAAPYAARLLGMLGATVVKLEGPTPDPARAYPVDDRPLNGISPLFLYLNAGKRNVRNTPERLTAALGWADLVIDSRTRGQVEPKLLSKAAEGAFRYTTVTAWGFDADESGDIDDELIVQAQSGVLTLTGNAGSAPLRYPGFQSQYLAGAFAAAGSAASVLAGDEGARRIDVAWVQAMTAGTEGSYQRYLHTHVVPPPAGANPLPSFPAGAFRCADGYVVPGTVRYHDWEMQCILYGRPELLSDERFSTPAARAENYRALWDEIQPWYDQHTRSEIFDAALDVGWACGKVVDSDDALVDEHLKERGFLGSLRFDGFAGVVPARIAKGLEPASPRIEVRAFGGDSDWFDEMVSAS